jgi:hypothetical protein
MILSGRSALKTRQKSKTVMGFSKMWKSGDKARVFYPIAKVEDGLTVPVAQCWGHKNDPKLLVPKRVFIPSYSNVDDGIPDVPDILYKFSKLAKLFIQGEYDLEIAKATGKQMTESQRRKVIQDIDKEFADKMRPVLGKLELVISTECVFVPLKSDGSPNIDEARLVSQDLSDSRLRDLFAIIDREQYGINENSQWMEVEYSFGTENDRKKDGRVSPEGLTAEYGLKNQYPDAWPKIEQLLTGLTPDSDIIKRRHSSFRPIPESEVIAAIALYSLRKSEFLDALESDDSKKALVRCAEIINMLNIPLTNEEIKEQLSEAEKERLGKEAEKAEEKALRAPTMADYMKDIEDAREHAGETVEDLASLESSLVGDLAAYGEQ